MLEQAISGKLAGRRVVITGASRGLGRAMAIIAADEGASVVLLARDRNKLQEVAEVISSRSQQTAEIIECDHSSPPSIASACQVVLATDSAVDVLINNAAPWSVGGLLEISDDEVTSTVAAAVSGTILVTKGLLPGLLKSESADVLTIVSTAGLPGAYTGDASSAFFAAKHGQSGFSESLRQELQPQNIRVGAIYPPDFDDLDPLSDDWSRVGGQHSTANMTNREVVATAMFMISAPRSCCFPTIVMNNMAK